MVFEHGEIIVQAIPESVWVQTGHFRLGLERCQEKDTVN